MRRVGKYVGLALVLVIVIAGGWLLSLLNHYNYFETVVSDEKFNCIPVPGSQGGEDVAVDWESQRAFISLGEIMRYDFGLEGEAVKVTPENLPIEVRSHGISLYVAPTGERKLFVVNHAAGRHQVLILNVSPDGALSFDANIEDDTYLYDPNDLHAVGPRQFYVANSTRLGASRYQSIIGALKFLSGNATGSVVYFDGEKFQTVASPITHGNGMHQSPDGTHIYVAQTTANSVVDYLRDVETGALTFQRTYEVPGSPDNISVSPKGELFVAAFPQFISFVQARLFGTGDLVPSQIVKVTPGAAGSVEPFWVNDGTLVAGATVGVPFAETGSTYRFFVSGAGKTLACAPKAS